MANFDNNNSDVPPNMLGFEKGVRSTMENFKKCTEAINFDNSDFMKIMVQMVKEQRDKFRQFAKDSIIFSDYLADYSIDILYFVECFKDDRHSNEDIVELLNDILNKSKEIHRLVKELKNIIARGNKGPENMDEILKAIKDDGNIGIKEKLTEVNNSLPKYVDDIKEDPNLINSDKKFKVKEESIKGKSYKSWSIAMIFVTVAFVAAAPAAASAVVAVEGVGMLLGTSAGVSCMVSLLMNSAANEKKNAVRDLLKQLDLERDELIEKIDLFDNDLNLVTVQIGRFDTFWETQIQRIEQLIKNFSVFDGSKRIKQGTNVNRIGSKWKDVEKECQIYSNTIRGILNSDVLLSINNKLKTPLIQ